MTRRIEPTDRFRAWARAVELPEDRLTQEAIALARDTGRSIFIKRDVTRGDSSERLDIE
jgi:hypothetical protein